MKRKSITASELVHALEQDPDYRARVAEREAKIEALSQVYRADEAALVAELRARGIAVESVWDFVSTTGDGLSTSAATDAPPEAIPILVAHLSESHHPRVWEGIVRALSAKSARDGAFESLKRFYVNETVESRRWLLANAIGEMAKFTEVKELPGMKEYRTLFNKPRKPPHRPPAI
jgi:hypothetical protein